MISQEKPIGPDESFIEQVRDALAHLYDHAYLMKHSLISIMGISIESDRMASMRELRRILLDTLETLRPRQDTPESDPAWRPYSVLYQRFVLGKNLIEVEADLSLGKRQLQREQRRGLEALALSLWQQQRKSTEPLPDDKQAALLQEISLVSASQTSTSLDGLLKTAQEAVHSLAEQWQTKLEISLAKSEMYALANPSLLKQLLVALLSFAVRNAPGGTVRVRLENKDNHPIINLSAITQLADPVPALPESAVALAQAQDLTIEQLNTEAFWTIQLRLHPPIKEKIVLMIEDNPDVISLFSRYATGHGYKIIGISDSSSVIQRIHEENPDTIILDVMMHERDGWEILQQLKADANLQSIPVVVCTVLPEPDLAKSLGADAFLQKPVRPAQLLECLLSLLAS